jgi:hypothetical protein
MRIELFLPEPLGAGTAKPDQTPSITGWLREMERASEGGGAPLAWAGAAPLSIKDQIPVENPSAAPLPSQGEPWEPRRVHASSDGTEAQVWVRDGRLAPEAEPRLAASLALELARRGLRLRALTINGQTAFEATEAYRHGND